MSKKNRRALRVADLVKRELSWLIEIYAKDMNIGIITITGVKLSADLKLAKIYYTIYNDHGSRKDDIDNILKKATPSLRSQLANKTKLKYTPELHFFYDDSIEYYHHINGLFKRIHEDKNN